MAGAALAVLYLAIVEWTGIMPQCLVKQLTGWSCPGCGSQRALHALINGGPARALSYNYFLPVTILFIALCGLHWVLPGNPLIEKTYRKITAPAALYILLGMVTAWTIVRNILRI